MPPAASYDEYLGSDDDEFNQALLEVDLDKLVKSAPRAGYGRSTSSLQPQQQDLSSRLVDGGMKRANSKSSGQQDDMYAASTFGGIGDFMRNKRRKLDLQNEALLDDDGGESNNDEGEAKPSERTQRSQILVGCHIYINGRLPDPHTLRSFISMITLHGGHYVPYLDRKSLITHICAEELTPKKRVEFRAYKVVKPQWILASIEQGRKLDWRKYALLGAAADSLDAGAEDIRAGSLLQDGGQTTHRAQRGLVSMFSKSTKPASSIAMQEIATRSDKGDTETIESLSARGVRLAQASLMAAKAKQAPSTSLFRSRPSVGAPASSTSSETAVHDSKVTTPKRQMIDPEPDHPSGPSPSTDLAGPVTAALHPWLPQKSRNERTAGLLNDPDWMSKHTSASEDFLQGYFQQSRLHHLSTWKEELKTLVASLQPASKAPVRKKRLTGTAGDGRTIFHVDFDCFFVSAGLTTRPWLRGKPVAVCHAKAGADAASSTSEIASCSYEARAKGVKNGMSLGRARELCDDILTMPFEFDLYKSIASKFYAILLSHALYLQAVSIDEVLMEVRVPDAAGNLSSSPDPALNFAQAIRDEIRAATGCEASIGISHNILLARLASRRAKPANAFHLLSDDVPTFLAPLNVEALPGIGWSLRDKLKEELNVVTLQDLLQIRPSELARVIGEGNGRKFAQFARGIDDRELDVGKPRQSVSTEVNYGIRFEKPEQVDRFMRDLGIETAKRLRNEGLHARALTLKVMQRHPDAPTETPKFLGHGWCVTQTAQSPIAEVGGKATDDGGIVGETALALLKKMNIPLHELRGIGIQLQKLEKDGRSVDAALEKGQGTLSFLKAKAAPPPPPNKTVFHSRPTPIRENSEPSPSPVKIAHPPPNQQRQIATPSKSNKPVRKDPSIIILGDSDDEPAVQIPVVQPAETVPAKRKTREPSEPYVPSLFQARKKAAPPTPPTTSQVPDVELEHYGIDPDVFRALPRRHQSAALRDARKSHFAPPKLDRKKPDPPRITGRVTKSALDKPAAVGSKARSESRGKSTTPAPAPAPVPEPVVRLTPPNTANAAALALSSTPDTWTDEQIAGFGLDVESFRALPPWLQLEHAKEQRNLARTKNSLRVVAIRRGPVDPTESTHSKIRRVAIRAPVRFAGRTSADDVRQCVESWIAHASKNELDPCDLERLAKFLEKSVARNRGCDLTMAVDLMEWWKILLDQECGPRAAATGVGKTMWTGFEDVQARVDLAIKQAYGSACIKC